MPLPQAKTSLLFGLLVLMSLSPSLHGGQILWAGETVALAGPPYPYNPQLGFEVTIGYGSKADTIGDGIWFTRPGTCDLSSDPDLSNFLSMATNGVINPLTIAIMDGDDHQVPYTYPDERFVFNRYDSPDLWPLPVTGVQIDVVGIYEPGAGGTSGVVVRWDFLGVPEPTTALLLLLGAGLVRRHPNR